MLFYWEVVAVCGRFLPVGHESISYLQSDSRWCRHYIKREFSAAAQAEECGRTRAQATGMARQRWAHYRRHRHRRAGASLRRAALLYHADLPVRRRGRLLRSFAGHYLPAPVGQPAFLPPRVAHFRALRSPEPRQFAGRVRAVDGAAAVGLVLSSQFRVSGVEFPACAISNAKHYRATLHEHVERTGTENRYLGTRFLNWELGTDNCFLAS